MPLTLLTGDYHLESIPILSVNSIPYKHETVFLKSCSFLSHDSLCTPAPPTLLIPGILKRSKWSNCLALSKTRPMVPQLQPGNLWVSQSQAFVSSTLMGARSEPRSHFLHVATIFTDLHRLQLSHWHLEFFLKICLHSCSFRNSLPFLLFAQVYTQSGCIVIPLRATKTLEVVNAVAVLSKYSSKKFDFPGN